MFAQTIAAKSVLKHNYFRKGLISLMKLAVGSTAYKALTCHLNKPLLTIQVICDRDKPSRCEHLNKHGPRKFAFHLPESEIGVIIFYTLINTGVKTFFIENKLRTKINLTPLYTT